MSKTAKVTGGEEPFFRRRDYGPRSWINIRNVPEGAKPRCRRDTRGFSATWPSLACPRVRAGSDRLRAKATVSAGEYAARSKEKDHCGPSEITLLPVAKPRTRGSLSLAAQQLDCGRKAQPQIVVSGQVSASNRALTANSRSWGVGPTSRAAIGILRKADLR